MIVARDGRVVLRRIAAADLPQISGFEYTVSIVEPMTGRARLAEVFAQTGFWTEDAGALAITVADRLVGTVQFYRSGLCIHGYEIGYILHGAADRGKGYGAEALRMFTGLLFAERPACHRLQLIIETWNLVFGDPPLEAVRHAHVERAQLLIGDDVDPVAQD